MIDAWHVKGKFRELEEEKLEEMFDSQSHALKRLGALSSNDLGVYIPNDLPLWALVELQADVIKLELLYNPELAKVIQ